MKSLTIVFQSIYALLTLSFGAAGYIYVVHGLGGDSIMGILALGIIGVLAAMLYQLDRWFVQEALPQLKRIYAHRREIRAAAKTAKANAPPHFGGGFGMDGDYRLHTVHFQRVSS